MPDPTLYPITIYQGSLWDRTFLFKNPDGTPINLSGYSARMQIRTLPTSLATLIDAQSTGIAPNPRIVLGGGAGTAQVILPPATTMLLSQPSAFYDLELTPPSGDTEKWLRGPVTIVLEVTR